MIFYILFLLPFMLLSWLLYCTFCLVRNYIRARKIGIPIVLLPIDPGNHLWQSIDRPIIAIAKRLPFGSGTWTRYQWRGWEIPDRYRAHQELGDAFIFVTPGNSWLQLCDAEACADVFRRRDDFPRPVEMVEMLNVFGPSVATTEGQLYLRHRRATIPCFNENVSQLVWAESIRQAKGMLEYWTSKASINTVAADTRTLSLHVLSSAGFGKSYPFQSFDDSATAEAASSYRGSLKLILDDCVPLVVLGRKNLDRWYRWLPARWKALHQATVTFSQYMKTVYEEEQRNLIENEKKQESSNLVKSLIRASNEMANSSYADEASDSKSAQGGLSEEEIYGNMFIFSFAGHDTTAHVLAFAIVLLSTRPDVQDWVAEELQRVLRDEQSPVEENYNAVFPRLKRCLAVLYETLRLYAPSAIMKASNATPQPLKVGGKTLTIPPHTMIIPSYSALHTHPRHWGHDSLLWSPYRWITTTNQSTESTLLEFPKTGSPFVAWSGGARSCPGRKFSQVEFVGVMVALFRSWRVEPVRREGESEGMARSRVARLVEKECGMVLLLQLLHPEKAVLRWVRR